MGRYRARRAQSSVPSQESVAYCWDDMGASSRRDEDGDGMSIVDESQRRECPHIVPALSGGGGTGRLRRQPSSTIPSASPSPSSGLLGFGSVALPTICNGFLTQDTRRICEVVHTVYCAVRGGRATPRSASSGLAMPLPASDAAGALLSLARRRYKIGTSKSWGEPCGET